MMPLLAQILFCAGGTVLVLACLFRRYGQLERPGQPRPVLTRLHEQEKQCFIRPDTDVDLDISTN